MLRFTSLSLQKFICHGRSLRPGFLRRSCSCRSFQGAPAIGTRPYLPDTLTGGGTFLAGDALLLQQRQLLAGHVLLLRRRIAAGHGLRRRLPACVVAVRRRPWRRRRGEGADGGEPGLRRGRRGSAGGFRLDLFVQAPKQKAEEAKRSVSRREWE